jgi:hypothetical protein
MLLGDARSLGRLVRDAKRFDRLLPDHLSADLAILPA